MDNIVLKIKEKLNEDLKEINKLEIDKDIKDNIKDINENYIKNANITELITIDQKFNNIINQVKLNTETYRKNIFSELKNVDFDLLPYFKINKDKSKIEQSINKATNNKDLGKINDEIIKIKTDLINAKNSKITEINNKITEINNSIDIIDKITIIEIKEKIDKILTDTKNLSNNNSKKDDFEKIEKEIKEKEEKLNNKLTEVKSGFENINKNIIEKNNIIGSTITDIKIDDSFNYDKILDIQKKIENNSKSIDDKIKQLNSDYKSQLDEFNRYIILFNEFYKNFDCDLDEDFKNEYKDLKIENSSKDLENYKKINDTKLKELEKKFKNLKEAFIDTYKENINDLNNFFKINNEELEKFDKDLFTNDYVKAKIEYISSKKEEKGRVIKEIKTHNEDNNFKNYLSKKLNSFKDIKEINYEDVEFIDIDKVQNNIINSLKEEDRIYIQSDIEGKYEVLLSVLKLANIIDINKKLDVYYNFLNGKFEDKNPGDNISMKLNIFEVNKDFKGTYINIGDIVDRCAGKHNCLKTLLLILYIKQELGDKIKLICGNHEIDWYCNKRNKECNCCKDIKCLTTLICYKAISLGQIKFFDNIIIESKKYVLSHKIIYHSNKVKGTKEFKNILEYIDKDKCSDINNYDDYIDKDGHFLTNKGFEILDQFNDEFKKNFEKFISNINIYTYDEKYVNFFIFNYKKSLKYNNMVDYNRRYKEDKLGKKVKNIIKNSINGHDHHDYEECYNKDINILIADNRSHVDDDLTNYKSNIHFIDKTKDIINDKIIEITKDKTEIYDLEQNKYIDI